MKVKAVLDILRVIETRKTLALEVLCHNSGGSTRVVLASYDMRKISGDIPHEQLFRLLLDRAARYNDVAQQTEWEAKTVAETFTVKDADK